MARTTKRKAVKREPDGTLGSLKVGTYFGIGSNTGRVAWHHGPDTTFVHWDGVRNPKQMAASDSVDWWQEAEYLIFDRSETDPLR